MFFSLVVADDIEIHDRLYCRELVVLGKDDHVLAYIGTEDNETNGVMFLTHSEALSESMVILSGGSKVQDGSVSGAVGVRSPKGSYLMYIDPEIGGSFKDF